MCWHQWHCMLLLATYMLVSKTVCMACVSGRHACIDAA